MTKYDKHGCELKNEAECEEDIEEDMYSYEGALEEKFSDEI